LDFELDATDGDFELEFLGWWTGWTGWWEWGWGAFVVNEKESRKGWVCLDSIGSDKWDRLEGMGNRFDTQLDTPGLEWAAFG
jgi:hypothetical protein